MFEILMAQKRSVGKNNFAIFDPGSGAAGTKASDKYSFTNDAVTPSAVMNIFINTAGAGNRDFGIFAGGSSNGSSWRSAVVKYLYANDTIANGSALGTAKSAAAAVGNSALAVIKGGNTISSESVATADHYNYSSDARTNSTVLGQARARLNAAGNSVMGIFTGGWRPTLGVSGYSDKHTYSSGSNVAAATLTYFRQGMGACGTATAGYFVAGAGNGGGTTETYTYASNTMVVSADQTTLSSFGCAGSNDTQGIFQIGASGRTDKRIFASGVTARTTNLSYTRSYASCVSSNPGGFSD